MKIAVIGDIHSYLLPNDMDYFNTSNYDAILLTGDFPWHLQNGTNRVLKLLNRSFIPVYGIFGNHDSASLIQLAGEVFQKKWVKALGSLLHPVRFDLLNRSARRVKIAGYTRFTLHNHWGIPGVDEGQPKESKPVLDLIIARPFSMGGPGITYEHLLKKKFDVSSLEESRDKILGLIKSVPSKRPYIILAHNGPAGLGEEHTDLFGCDFKQQGGDWGDSDLAEAIDKAAKKPLAVIAGHMHHRLKKSRKTRNWALYKDNIWFVNAARVPRVFKDVNRGELRHHLSLEFHDDKVEVTEMLVDKRQRVIMKAMDPEVSQPQR